MSTATPDPHPKGACRCNACWLTGNGAARLCAYCGAAARADFMVYVGGGQFEVRTYCVDKRCWLRLRADSAAGDRLWRAEQRRVQV